MNRGGASPTERIGPRLETSRCTEHGMLTTVMPSDVGWLALAGAADRLPSGLDDMHAYDRANSSVLRSYKEEKRMSRKPKARRN